MNFKRILFVFSLLVITLSNAAFIAPKVNDPDDIIGVWKTGTGKGMVKIYKEGDIYYGKIVWLLTPNDPKTNKPQLDAKNEDASLRTRPILGMINLKGFKSNGKNSWSGGLIYNPEDGKEYKCVMTLKSDGTLNVRGYVGIKMFGKTQTWTKQGAK
jgi:uncharacterized protein (DUF2147 family)